MPRITRAQRKRLLERIATLLHEDVNTEGFQEQCETLGLSVETGAAWMRKERDALLRRAARLGSGEAETRITTAPAASP